MHLQKKYIWFLITSILILVILAIFLLKAFVNEPETATKDRTFTISDSASYPHNKSLYVQAQMHNVDFRIDSEIVLQIKNLRGRLIPATKYEHPIFNKKESFLLEIYSADIKMDMKSLSALLNKYVFNYKGSPLKNILVSTSGDNLKQEGTIHNIPFSMVSTISVTPEGKMKLHPNEIKAVGIKIEGLLKLLKVEMQELISTDSSHVINIIDNDLYLDPALMLPPPRIRGHLKSIVVKDEEISLIFFSKSSPPLNPVITKANYMYFQGGYLTFGKLTMADADMQIIDLNPKNPFDFYLNHFFEQLTAGYHKTTSVDGLLVYMPDYSTLPKKYSK